MSKILANDGIHNTGKKMLEEAGFVVDTQKVNQEDLPSRLNEYDAIIVRSATTVRKERSEEHTSELQSRGHLVCRLLLEKKKNDTITSRREKKHMKPKL